MSDVTSAATSTASNGAAPGEAILRMRDVDAAYGETQVLWDVSLEVHAGEVVALVGANGAGKSTLLNVLSGLLHPLRGEVVYHGQRIERMTPEAIAARGLVHAPQGRRLFAGLSVEENLRLGAYTRRARSSKAITADLEKVYTLLPKLRERRTQTAGSLSGGEQQMCTIGRGLMARPEVLLIDELSLGLAPNVVDDILAAVDRIHREEGLGFVLVEQDVQIALERADRGYVIENGRIVVEGPGRELLGSERVRAAYLGE